MGRGAGGRGRASLEGLRPRALVLLARPGAENAAARHGRRAPAAHLPLPRGRRRDRAAVARAARRRRGLPPRVRPRPGRGRRGRGGRPGRAPRRRRGADRARRRARRPPPRPGARCRWCPGSPCSAGLSAPTDLGRRLRHRRGPGPARRRRRRPRRPARRRGRGQRTAAARRSSSPPRRSRCAWPSTPRCCGAPTRSPRRSRATAPPRSRPTPAWWRTRGALTGAVGIPALAARLDAGARADSIFADPFDDPGPEGPPPRLVVVDGRGGPRDPPARATTPRAATPWPTSSRSTTSGSRGPTCGRVAVRAVGAGAAPRPRGALPGAGHGRDRRGSRRHAPRRRRLIHTPAAGGHTVELLEGTVRPYAWGSRTHIAELRGRARAVRRTRRPSCGSAPTATTRPPSAAGRTLLDALAEDPRGRLRRASAPSTGAGGCRSC